MTIFPKRKPSLFEVKDYDSFRQMLEETVKESGDTVAVKYRKKSSSFDVTYNELLSVINALGTGLESLEEPPRRIALLCPNSFHFIAVFLCALCSHYVLIPVDSALPGAEIVNVLNHSDCDTLFIDRSFLPFYQESKKNLPKIASCICFGIKEHEAAEGVLPYSLIIERGRSALDEGDDSYISASVGENETAIIHYKSSITDTLLGVELSKGALMSAVKGFLQLTNPEGRCLSCQPFDRPFELICGLLASFYNGATVCINSSLKNFQKDLTEFSPDYMFLPPLYVENIWLKLTGTIESQGRTDTFNTLAKTSSAMRKIGIDRRRVFFEKIHEGLGGKLTKIYVGGASIDPEAVKFFDVIGVAVLGGYGLSECASVVSQNREGQTDFESSGVLLPCVKVKIDGADSEGVGEICVIGPNVMTGFYKNERATKEAFDDKGWLHTGDLGKITSSGQLYVTGKTRTEILLKSGRCVLPEEIESYLLTIPFIKSAKVYAGKDARGAEIHLCADLTVDGSLSKMPKAERSALIKERLEHLNAGLPADKRVKTVHIKQQEDV